MSKPSRAAIFDLLNTWCPPGASQSLVAMKAVKGMEVEGNQLAITLHLLDTLQAQEAPIREALTEKLRALDGVEAVQLHMTWEASPEPVNVNLLPTVKAAVVVGSGKGGVGKSTVATNLACACARLGMKVGLLDADIYGPSMTLMLGIHEGPDATAEGKIIPLEKFGMKVMSMGFLIDEDQPVLWRGPMLNKAISQFLGDVVWGDLDVLFVDLPPGTGDVQISMVQNAKEAMERGGAVVVSTPQDVAFLDAKKAIGLFQTVRIPILGVVENMSSFLCPHCQGETHIFGHGTVKAAAERMRLPFLGEVPIDLAIRQGSDEGKPIVMEHPDSPQAKVFMDMARQIQGKCRL